MDLAILGATGRIGRALVAEAVARGHAVSAQGRKAPDRLPPGATGLAADPMDAAALASVVKGREAIIYALGFRGRGQVTFFSATTRALVSAMRAQGVRRLVAITGVGAGETRGHGGWLYDWITYPLFTRDLYADKNRQEALIRDSGLDWTILRPAPFAASPGDEPFHVLTTVRPGTRLSRVTEAEVARFALDCAESGGHRGEAVFFGHGVAG